MAGMEDGSAGPGALPTFGVDVQQATRVREFPSAAGAEVANVFSNLSSQLNAFQDRASQDIGVRQGKVAGLDPNYRPDQDESLQGIARRNAANATYSNSIEATARNQLGAAYEQYSQLPADQRTPDKLQASIKAIQDDFDQNHVFPEIKGQFDNSFGLIASQYLKGAQSDVDARNQDQAKASFLTNQNSARYTALRVASIPSSTDAAIADQVRQHDASVDAAVNQGIYTAAQAVELKAGFRQDVLSTRVLSQFQNTPDADKPAFLHNFQQQFAGAGGDFLSNVKRAESGGNNTAGDPAHAYGAFQFMPGTWANLRATHPALNLSPDGRDDPVEAQKAAAALAADNDAALTKAGLPTSNVNRYMAWFLGAGGATSFMSALAKDPSASFASVFPKEAAANPGVAQAGSLAGVYSLMAAKINGGPSPGAQGRATGLAADTVTRLDGAMGAALRSVASQAQHAQKAAVGDIGGDLKQIEAGYDVPDAEWAAKRAQYAASPDPVVASEFRSADAIRSMYAGFKGLPPAAVDAQVSAMQATLAKSGASPDQARLVEAAAKYATKLRGDFDRNPLARAAADGVIPAAPALDFSSPQTLGRGLEARVALADQTAQHYGLARAPLVTPDDREAVKSIAAAGGEPMVQAAATITRTLGSRAGDFLSQLGGEAPQFAQMGRVAAMGGDPGLLRDAAWAISQDHQQGGKVQRPAPESLQQAIQTTYGTAMAAIPDFAQGAKNLASSALAAHIMREALDPKALDQNLIKQYLQKAAGATYLGGAQYGGVASTGGWGGQQALAPANLRADQFGAALKTIQDADLKALPAPPTAPDGTVMTADQMRSMRMTPLGPGVYLLSKGDPQGDDPQWATVAGGGRGSRTRFVLDLNAMEPQLRARLPGAYK